MSQDGGPYDLEDVRRRVAAVQWYHRFEIVPGVVTNGIQPTQAKDFFEWFAVPEDLSGKKVLEVATYDGPVAFEAEKRGAMVTALDIQDPDKTGFNVAKSILGSRVRYVMGSVYELDRLIPERFDYVFCLGLFYHLKHPVLAFEKIAGALDEGGHLFFEGECLRVYGEDAHGRPLKEKWIRHLADSDIPVALYYEDKYKSDPSNWFVPNFACLRGWLETAGFDVVSHFFIELRKYKPPSQRVVGVARKALSRLRMENARVGYPYPYPD
jgi:tRNA (mo5U34)-methyltransferase